MQRLDNKSRMNREIHVRFCEGLGVKLPRSTRQSVCGAVYCQHEAPVDPSSLTRCRQRIGAAGCARILQVTVALGVQSKAVKTTDFKRVTVDTTVQEISGELSDRQQVAESVPGAVGTVMSQTGGGVTPEHCP